MRLSAVRDVLFPSTWSAPVERGGIVALLVVPAGRLTLGAVIPGEERALDYAFWLLFVWVAYKLGEATGIREVLDQVSPAERERITWRVARG